MITDTNKHFLASFGHENYVDKLVNDKDSNVRASIARNPNLQPHHVDRILDTNHSESIHSIALNRELSDDHFNKILGKHKVFMMSLSENPRLTDSQVDKCVDSEPCFSIGKHKKLKSHHIDKLLNKFSYVVRRDLASRKDLQPHHVEKLLNDKDASVRIAILSNPKYQDYLKAKK